MNLATDTRTWRPVAVLSACALLVACSDDVPDRVPSGSGPSDGSTGPVMVFGDGGADDDGGTDPFPSGFSWVYQGKLGGMPHPGAGAWAEPALRLLEAHGVTRFVSLTETPIDPEVVKKFGMQPEHIPIVDFTPPTQEQILEFVGLVETEIEVNDGKLVAHDTAGKGRLGTMLASWFIYKGATSDKAIKKIRKLRPGSIETVPQEDSLHEYSRAIHGDDSDAGK